MNVTIEHFLFCIYQVNSTAELVCDDGYQVWDNYGKHKNKVTCGANGQWLNQEKLKLF